MFINNFRGYLKNFPKFPEKMEGTGRLGGGQIMFTLFHKNLFFGPNGMRIAM